MKKPDMLLEALHYASRGWPVFPVTQYKTPFAGTNGHLEATTDTATITKWWTERKWANIGLATGDLVVFDADGDGGLETLFTIAGRTLPQTLLAKTARGYHFYFRAPAGMHVRCRNEGRKEKGADGLDYKAHGGYVLLPPSYNKEKKVRYAWANRSDIAELPPRLIEYLQTQGSILTHDEAKLDRPAFMAAEDNNTTSLANSLTYTLTHLDFNAHNEARVRSALAAFDVGKMSYDHFYQVGMGLKRLQWSDERGDVGFLLWDELCRRSPHYKPEGLERKWPSFRENSRKLVTIGTVFRWAKEHGWQGEVKAETPKETNGFHSFDNVMPQAISQTPIPERIIFPDTDKAGGPRATCLNTRKAIRGLGIVCEYDCFHDKMRLGGHAIGQWAGDLTDNAVQLLRGMIRDVYGFDPGRDNAFDAATLECLQHAYDPVLDYLSGLQWDGQKRLDSWLATYMGAEASELHAQIGRLVLIAAVRRARQPGIKFDQIIVLEGPEGRGKSSAIEILAGADNFSDQTILSLDDRGQQEAMQGIWLYEIADLSGMRRAEVEHIKAFASRNRDRARPAYGRTRVDRPRRCIFFATTNDESYLKSQTGNRRFWPVTCSHVDLEGLKRDRDQLWAEAAYCESQGAPVTLPERYWGMAKAVQESRLEADEWEGHIADWLHKHVPSPDEGATISQILAGSLRIDAREIGRTEQMRASAVLKKLGWERWRATSEAGREWRYRRVSLPIVGTMGDGRDARNAL